MRLDRIGLFAGSVAFILVFSLSVSLAEDFSKVPANGVVTMVDLGAKKCIPCKMMAPILAKLEKVYAGKAAIVFIDVWENTDQASRFKVRVIPTQIFFNDKGQEVFRHVGFFDEKSIVEQLNKMGIEKPGTNEQG